MSCGIYKIVNLITGDFYIGQSIFIESRKNQHWCGLRGNKRGNTHLQNAWNKYGEDTFTFEIILYCEPFELTRYEQALVNKWKPVYNIRTECTDSNRGIKFSEESSRKKSLASTGRIFSEEHRHNISLATKGKSHGIMSEEQKQKISKTTLGKICTEEHKRKVSEVKRNSQTNLEHLRNLAKNQKEQAIVDYYNNPNYCINCGKVIPIKNNERPCITKTKKFCSKDCRYRKGK